MPQKQKIAPEEKVKVVRRFLKGDIGQTEATKLLSVNGSTFRKWILQYQSEGINAFLPRTSNRVYPAELKVQAVLSYLNDDGSQLEICRKYKIHSTNRLGAWIKVYNAHGDLGSRKHS